VHYVDPGTGIEHLWGFGHLMVRVTKPSVNTRAILTGSSTIGLAVGSTTAERYLALGVARQERAEVVEADTALCVEWPTFGAVGIRIGSGWARGEATNTCE
jgi:hypothetical protein